MAFVALFPALTVDDCAEDGGDAVRKPKVGVGVVGRGGQRSSANEKNANLGGEMLHLASLMRDHGDQQRGRLQLWVAGEDQWGGAGLRGTWRTRCVFMEDTDSPFQGKAGQGFRADPPCCFAA